MLCLCAQRKRYRNWAAVTTTDEHFSRSELWQMLNAFEKSRAIQVAAILGIADLLAGGPRDVDDLATATATHAPTLYRLLRALASVGVFVEDPHARFGLTPGAEYLRSDVADSVRDWAIMVGGQSFWSSWNGLLDSVRTGDTAFQKLRGGMTNWQYRARHPGEGAVFDAAMTARSGAIVAAIATGYDFSQFGVLADIGAGHGVLLAAILSANAAMHGILFDQPHVVADAPAVLQRARIANRCEVVGGDFFECIPSGADAYLLKSILHDWDDAHATRILERCRDAMAPAAKLLVVELVIRPNEPDPETMFTDLRMLVMNGGRERTADDFHELFGAAGFRLCNIIRTQSLGCIIEGVPV